VNIKLKYWDRVNLLIEFLLAVTSSGSLAAIRAANGWGRREPFRVLVIVEDSDRKEENIVE